MLLFDQSPDLQNQCLAKRTRGCVIGLVPTMGNLHEGHMSLVRKAQTESDFVIVSIFVNPLQFNDLKDFARYPRTLEQDLELLRKENVHAVFSPSEKDFYGDHMSVQVVESELSKVACGRNRKGHFEGVCTVVLKLFNICQPHKAFFGQKDYQQVCVIKRMVQNLSVPVVIRECPTVRESSGLAMSSRNNLLSPEDRAAAAGIYRTLNRMKQVVQEKKSGALWSVMYEWGIKAFEEEMPKSFELEYLEAFEQNTFIPLQPKSACGPQVVFCVAGKLSGVRLIDNIMVA